MLQLGPGNDGGYRQGKAVRSALHHIELLLHLPGHKGTFHQRVIGNKIDLSVSPARGHLHYGVKDKMGYKRAVLATGKSHYPGIILRIIPVSMKHALHQILIRNTGLEGTTIHESFTLWKSSVIAFSCCSAGTR